MTTVVDANRTIGQPDKITMVFGRRISKHHRRKLQTEIEDVNLPNPVTRSHYGDGFIKQYVRDHLILRTEAASNKIHDYGVNKSIPNLPGLRNALSAVNTTISTSSRIFSRPSLIVVSCDGSPNRP